MYSPPMVQSCLPSPSIFEQSYTTPIEPAFDCTDMSFELNGQWMAVEMTPNHGIEVVLPDTICPAMLRKELAANATVAESWAPRAAADNARPPPTAKEEVWMSAGLLTLAVDYIDTLLEDWYPGLGAREGNRTVESIPYVNRVVPCPFCVSHALPYSDFKKEKELEESTGSLTLSGNLKSQESKRSRGERNRSSNSGSKPSPPSVRHKLKRGQSSEETAPGSDVFHAESPPTKAKRSLFPKGSPCLSRLMCAAEAPVSAESPTKEDSSQPSSDNARWRSHSSPSTISDAVEEGDGPPLPRPDSLGHVHRVERLRQKQLSDGGGAWTHEYEN